MMIGKKKDVIGLDIGSSSVKLVELKEGKNGYNYKIWRSPLCHQKRSSTEP